MPTVSIECTGHDFDLEVDPRDYSLVPPGTAHRGVVCPTCARRVSFPVSAALAVLDEDATKVAAVDVSDDPENTATPPDPAYTYTPG